jgi:hypothetical protein
VTTNLLIGSLQLTLPQGHETLMINGISGAWGVICVFTFITFIGW